MLIIYHLKSEHSDTGPQSRGSNQAISFPKLKKNFWKYQKLFKLF